MTSKDAVYALGHHESVLRSQRWRTVENSAKYLLPYLKPGISLLDVGCGPGTITADLAARITPDSVTAVELTSEVLEFARAEATERQQSNITFVVSDVQSLAFPDGTFPVAALRDMRRVCRPGGIVAARDADYGTFTWFPAVPSLDAWLVLYQKMARATGGEPDAGRRLLSWARHAGLTDITATSTAWCFATPEDRAWWGGLWADRMVKSDLARQAVLLKAATKEDLHRLSEGWHAWAAAADGWMAVLHGEVIGRA